MTTMAQSVTFVPLAKKNDATLHFNYMKMFFNRKYQKLRQGQL